MVTAQLYAFIHAQYISGPSQCSYIYIDNVWKVIPIKYAVSVVYYFRHSTDMSCAKNIRETKQTILLAHINRGASCYCDFVLFVYI